MPVLPSGRGRHAFEGQLPFAVIVKEQIDNMWKGANSVAGNMTSDFCPLTFTKDRLFKRGLGGVEVSRSSRRYKNRILSVIKIPFMQNHAKPTFRRRMMNKSILDVLMSRFDIIYPHFCLRPH